MEVDLKYAFEIYHLQTKAITIVESLSQEVCLLRTPKASTTIVFIHCAKLLTESKVDTEFHFLSSYDRAV